MKFKPYSYKDWQRGIPLPLEFKAQQATDKYGWLTSEIDAMILAILPGKRSNSGQAMLWSDKMMLTKFNWRALPYGIFTSTSGDSLIQDRDYRSLCIVSKRKGVKVVPFDHPVRGFGAGRAMLYDDGSRPLECVETLRICRSITDRLGLGAECRRRGLLVSHGVLPTAVCPEYGRRERFALPWVSELKQALTERRIFAFDGLSGEVMRIIPPPEIDAQTGWLPRPLDNDDIKSVCRWLRKKGQKAEKKLVWDVVIAVACGWQQADLNESSKRIHSEKISLKH